jgi:SNF2 family DNA or RNA helicase
MSDQGVVVGQVEEGVRKSMEPFLKDEVQFYNHQITGVRQMMQMRNFILADDMGLGKSLQAITVAIGDVYRFTGEKRWAEKIIIVAPVNLKGNWSDELDKFTRVPHVILGQSVDPKNPERLRDLGPAKRQEQLDEFAAMEGPRFLITNYEQIEKHLVQLNSIGFDIIIFDEAHYLKNPAAKRTKACHKLRANRAWPLTGTPMLNQVNELWSLLHIVDPIRFPKYYSFRNRYCVFGGYQNKQIIGVKNEKELQEILNNYMIRRLKSDVLDLPEVQPIIKRIDLSAEQKRLYDKAEKELEIQMNGQADPSEIENALTKLLRLKQVCGTTLPFTGKDDSAKLDVAIEDAMELLANGHKIVVFTQFRDVLEAFATRLDKAMPEIPIWELHGDVKQYDRHTHVKEWGSSSGAGALVCMLQVAGVGLNMTAARHGLFLDKLWTPGLNQQAIDRLHRIGASETQAVQILEYHMKGTVETRVEQVLKTKSKLFGTIVNDADFKKRLLAELLKKNAA